MSVDNLLLEQEDRAWLDAQPEMPDAFAGFARPPEIPIDWHKTEQQSAIGSCQGNDLTSCLERLEFVATGNKIQLSRIFAYIATQKIDGITGDNGSTITGGAKLALKVGVPPESLTGYPSRYPDSAARAKILAQANYAAAAAHKAKSSCRFGADSDADKFMEFIAGGGAISFGIKWYSGLIPPDRVVRKFTPGTARGGHAMAILGYRANGNLLAVNSHGDGRYDITPPALKQMLKHPYSVFVGLMGNEGTPVDWTTKSPWDRQG